MTGEGAYDPLYVLDQNLPSVPAEGGQVTLTGKLAVGTGQQPPYFLEVGDPPDIVLMNSLARAGAVLLAALFAAAAVNWYVRRANYALSVPYGTADAAPAAPALLWFGVLGRAYGDAALRQAPAAMTVNRSEALIQSLGQGAPWSVVVRRLVTADPTIVATRYGALPAARLEFEDERGLKRRAVLATNSQASRDALIDSLRFVGGGS